MFYTVYRIFKNNFLPSTISRRTILYFTSIRFAFRKERCFKNRIDSFYIFNRTRIICIFSCNGYPIIKDQIDALIDNLPYFGHEIEQAARRFGESNLLGKIQENLNINVANMVKDYTVDFTKSLSSVTGNVTGFLSTITEVVLTFVMVPFILFYLLKDGEQLPNHFKVHFRAKTSSNENTR